MKADKLATEMRWDVDPPRHRVERRGRGGNYDRYWIDCPFCGEIVCTYGKDLLVGVKCGCGAILLATGVAVKAETSKFEAT